MKRMLPALLLCGVLLFSVPALTEDTLLRSPDTLEWDWTWGGFWRALFGISA